MQKPAKDLPIIPKMDVWAQIDRIIDKIGITNSFIIILVSFILLAALKIYLTIKNYFKNSHNKAHSEIKEDSFSAADYIFNDEEAENKEKKRGDFPIPPFPGKFSPAPGQEAAGKKSAPEHGPESGAENPKESTPENILEKIKSPPGFPKSKEETGVFSEHASKKAEKQEVKKFLFEEPLEGDPISSLKKRLQEDPELREFSLFINPKHVFKGALKDVFDKKISLLLSHWEEYKVKKFPFYKMNDGKIERFYIDKTPYVIIEELFELWRMGYQHEQLPELFIHYFFSIRSPNALTIFKSFILNGVIEKQPLQKILFLYHDLLHPYFAKYENFARSGVDAASDFNQDPVDFYRYIEHHEFYLSRALWQKWENGFLAHISEDGKGEFYHFYESSLYPRSSFILRYLLIHKYKHILSTHWRNFLERQAFYHGHYEKLSQLSFIPPEYVSLISRSREKSRHVFHDLLIMLQNKPFQELHIFLAKYLNTPKEAEKYFISQEKISEFLSHLDVHRKEPDYIPQAVRFILYLYFYEKKDNYHVNYLIPYIHGRMGKFIPRLYQIRTYFKNNQYEKAWDEISKLMQTEEENMLLMNEAAIYAYHAGKIKEAEEIFARLLKLYPDNPQVLHNKTVFLQHKGLYDRQSKNSGQPRTAPQNARNTTRDKMAV